MLQAGLVFSKTDDRYKFHGVRSSNVRLCNVARGAVRITHVSNAPRLDGAGFHDRRSYT